MLSDRGIIQTDKIDQESDTYNAWKNDSISLRDYLYDGIAESWIDTTKLKIESRYSDADSIYQTIVEYVMDDLQNDAAFTKKIFRYLVNNGTVSGKELCLALYDQNILAYDENEVRMLEAGGDEYAFQFIRNKISDIEITPAQLALDPCSASAVITDVNTGEVRALVTYPSYDNNKFSGTVDAEYYNNPGQHGPLDVIHGIQNSCNVFFSEMGHRLSMDENGNYSPELGIEKIRKYASMFGLDETSGIEIAEREPQMTTEKPEASSIGQGKNSYSNIQLSRYITAVANKGTVFKLSLLDKMTDSQGNLLKDFTPEVRSTIDVKDSTWNAVHTGMRRVISDGSARKIFSDLEVDIAGKTGTAEEIKNGHRINHAFFVSFAPYQNPEIAVTVNIPYGYSSSNAATAAKNIYRFYYGYTDLNYILNSSNV